MINVEWSVIKDFAREKRVNEQDLFNAVRRAVTVPQALEKQIAEAASAQGGQGAEAVAWDDPAVDPIVSKLYRKFKEWSRQGFGADDVTWCEVRGYVAELLNTNPQPAVPEEYRQALQDAYDIIVCDANSPKNYGSLCRIGHVLGQITTPTTPQADGWMLSETHRGMRISAEGALGRVRGQLKFGAQEMLKHLETMSDAFYSGNVKAVDQFLQTWDLDEKRPQPPAGQEGSGDE